MQRPELTFHLRVPSAHAGLDTKQRGIIHSRALTLWLTVHGTHRVECTWLMPPALSESPVGSGVAQS